jgi:hypothetical protein
MAVRESSRLDGIATSTVSILRGGILPVPIETTQETSSGGLSYKSRLSISIGWLEKIWPLINFYYVLISDDYISFIKPSLSASFDMNWRVVLDENEVLIRVAEVKRKQTVNKN